MTSPYPSETGCCPPFDPAPWQEQELQWANKLFVKDRVRCFFFMPLNFGNVMVRMMTQIGQAGGFTPERPVVLSDHTSRWNMDLYIEVSKEIPGLTNICLSGSFLTKVFEGPFKDTANWCQQMGDWVRSKGKSAKRQLMFYTTCPKCARHYGKNYVVIFAQV